jgi:hypothetical protein
MGFDVVAIFAAGRAVEVVLAVGVELPDPLMVQAEPTEQGRARRWRGHFYLHGSIHAHSVDPATLFITSDYV